MNKFEKKRLTKQNDYQVTSGAKITCAKFGGQNYQLLAAGDDQRNINLWKLSKNLPKLVINGHSTGVSELQFSGTAEQIYAGTFGGTIHVWDLASKREIAKLQGHMTKTTCLNSDQMGGTVLVSGSEDTKVKVWDLRTNKCIQTYREHTGVLNSVQLSPDSRWVASGGEDGTLRIWDIASGKTLQTFPIAGQSITCIQYNPQNLALANGSTDRTVKYWDLEQFSSINVTPQDSSPITNLTFDEDRNAEFLFAASNESIKLWNIETNKLLDCLSIIPKNISDLRIASEERFLQMSALSNNTISVWYAPLESINYDDTIDTVPSSDSLKSQQDQHMMAVMQPQKSNFVKSQQTSEEIESQRSKQLKENPFANVQPKQDPQQFQQERKPSLKQVSQVNPQQMQQQQEDTEMQDLSRATYVKSPYDKPIGIDMNSFDVDKSQAPQKRDLEIINECMGNHATLVSVMQRRTNQVNIIQNWWTKGNITSAINALNMMNDTSTVMDVVNNTFAENQKVDILNYENISTITTHCVTLVNSKYETHILAGLKAILNILKHWAPQMIQIKTVPVGSGVDLAREERLKKVDTCIENFKNFYKCKGFQKSLQREGEVQEIGKMVNNHLTNLLNKTGRELEAD
eukprot:403341515